MSRLNNMRGLTLIELVVTMVILSILASLIVPSARLTAKRTKEIELRRDLREIRRAIDNYYADYQEAVKEGKIPKVLDESGYPKTLQVLVDGYDFGGLYKDKQRFLRRIPKDPFQPENAEKPGWGLRSYEDEPDSTIWGGQDVYDVYSLSDGTAIDGTKYKDW